MIDLNAQINEAIRAAGNTGTSLSDVEQALRGLSADFAKVPRTFTRRGAMEWAIQFAFEHPGSTGVIYGVTAVSLNMLFRGRDGLRHCLSDRLINNIEAQGTSIRFSNGSQIIGYPASTAHRHHFDGLNINYVLVEVGARYENSHTWQALTARIRPLPGVENCIITIVDDEADE